MSLYLQVFFQAAFLQATEGEIDKIAIDRHQQELERSFGHCPGPKVFAHIEGEPDCIEQQAPQNADRRTGRQAPGKGHGLAVQQQAVGKPPQRRRKGKAREER